MTDADINSLKTEVFDLTEQGIILQTQLAAIQAQINEKRKAVLEAENHKTQLAAIQAQIKELVPNGL